MPLMHAENLALQDECVQRFRQLALDAPDELKPRLAGNGDFAAQHRDIIARFGRFPYRNAALGRASKPGPNSCCTSTRLSAIQWMARSRLFI